MYYPKQAEWAAQADELRPQMFHQTVTPRRLVRTVADAAAYQGVRVEEAAPLADFINAAEPRWLAKDFAFTCDFGTHCVGRVELEIATTARMDAPLRLELKFAECPYELHRDFDSYHGELARGWLQEHLLVVDAPVPDKIVLPRRYAFRYLRVALRQGAPGYQVRFRRVACVTETSADWAALPPAPDAMAAIDRRVREAGLLTLANCMQSVFEDGPKRDRRLWLGDLRLQALANYRSFRNFSLVKRSLLYLAAAADDDGLMAASCYPRGAAVLPDCQIYDYALLFGDVVLDYLRASGDAAFAKEMLPAALRQCELALARFPQDAYDGKGSLWLFIDWQDGLNKNCAAHGLTCYAFARVIELAQALGEAERAAPYAAALAKMRAAGRARWFDAALGLFVDEGQVSFAAQLWCALGGVVDEETARGALRRVIALFRDPGAAAALPGGAIPGGRVVGPGGPFLYNQMAIALEKLGLAGDARELTRDYWGKMVERGFDTFWEVFVPEDPLRSPYRDCLINSCCHAWSTPVCGV